LNSALLLAAPLTAQAEPAPAPQFTVDEVRADYAQQGFSVDPPVAWSTANQLTTIRVTDPHTDRVLMMLVHPDATIADAARSRVQELESDNTGRLVRGYGRAPGSVVRRWRGVHVRG
jgi:hypothetical protein